jgi:hypothetical protein
MHLGMYIAMYVGLRQGDIMDLAAIDTTDPHRKMRRFSVRVPGLRVKTRIWFDGVGAERIPQKSIKTMRSAYKKRNMNYWYYLELGNTDQAVQNRERAQRMSKYVKSPDPDTEPHVSLKK